jgi:sortase A
MSPAVGNEAAAGAGPAAAQVHGRPRWRPPLGSLVRTLSIALIVAGVLCLVDAGVTLLWQEPVTALYAWLQQRGLAGDLNRLDRAAPTPDERTVLARLDAERLRIAFLARELRRSAKAGSAVGRIEIPRIHAGYVVVAGTTTAALIKGPGVYEQTTFPGAPGTVGIAGHRTTYLAPFHDINRLRPGDRITVTMPYAQLTYRVESLRVVLPTALWVIRYRGYDRLVLSACHPLFSAAHRIVVFARLQTEAPRGPALALPGSSPTPFTPPADAATASAAVDATSATGGATPTRGSRAPQATPPGSPVNSDPTPS